MWAILPHLSIQDSFGRSATHDDSMLGTLLMCSRHCRDCRMGCIRAGSQHLGIDCSIGCDFDWCSMDCSSLDCMDGSMRYCTCLNMARSCMQNLIQPIHCYQSRYCSHCYSCCNNHFHISHYCSHCYCSHCYCCYNSHSNINHYCSHCYSRCISDCRIGRYRNCSCLDRLENHMCLLLK